MSDIPWKTRIQKIISELVGIQSQLIRDSSSTLSDKLLSIFVGVVVAGILPSAIITNSAIVTDTRAGSPTSERSARAREM